MGDQARPGQVVIVGGGFAGLFAARALRGGPFRVLWTLCGVGIGVLVMLLAGLLARHTSKASAQQAT
jgi:succinate dehydrogenase/fumarate reductase flavoprotein subunit